jgi:ribonuclease P protein component
MDRTYPRSSRLTRKREIDRVMRRGRRAADGTMRLFGLGGGAGGPRFAPVVPGRLCNAPQRNRWKRLMRESFRLNRGAFDAGVDLVAMPLVPPGAIRQPEVARALVALYARVRP